MPNLFTRVIIKFLWISNPSIIMSWFFLPTRLGFIMGSVTTTARASSNKLKYVMSFIHDKIFFSRISVKDLAKAAGHLAALYPAFGYLVLLVTHSVYKPSKMHDRFGWSGFLELNQDILQELNLFFDYAPVLNGFFSFARTSSTCHSGSSSFLSHHCRWCFGHRCLLLFHSIAFKVLL